MRPPLPPIVTAPQLELSEREKIRVQCRDAMPLVGTLAESYLRGRALDVDGKANDVGFHLNCYGRGPAVVFKIHDADGELVAAQGRFLEPRGERKTMDVGRKSSGVYATAGALMSPIVAICEGPINALSLVAVGRRRSRRWAG